MIKIINIIIVIFLISVLFIISFLDSKVDLKKKKVIVLTFTTILIVFLGFRSIGLDLEAYRSIFNYSRIVSIGELFSGKIFANQLEPFFLVLISFLKTYNLSFIWFLLISGGIPMLIIYNVIKKNEEKHMLVTFLFFLLLYYLKGPVDIIRHFFAASLYLSALYSLSQQKKIKFWSKNLFSVLIHYSNLAVVFLRPLLKIKWNISKYITSMLLTFIFGYIAKYLIGHLVHLNLSYSGNIIIWKFIYYLTYYNAEGYVYLGSLHRILLFIMSYFPVVFNIVFILLALNKIELIKRNPFYNLLLNSQIIGSLIVILFLIINASTLGLRLNFLFSIGNFFLVKEIIFSYYDTKKKKLFAFTILSLVFYNFIIVLYFAGVHDPMSPFYLF
jgi:hypothetical protein